MLPKSCRLPSSKILPTIKKGKLFPSKNFNIRWLPVGPTSPKASLGIKGLKIAIVVPVRLDKRAVKRNRAKRLLREAIRQYLPKIKTCGEMVILANKNTFSATFQELSKEINVAVAFMTP